MPGAGRLLDGVEGTGGRHYDTYRRQPCRPRFGRNEDVATWSPDTPEETTGQWLTRRRPAQNAAKGSQVHHEHFDIRADQAQSAPCRGWGQKEVTQTELGKINRA